MPLTFIFIIIIKYFYTKKFFVLKKNFFLSSFFVTFTYIFWPYLWADPLDNF